MIKNNNFLNMRKRNRLFNGIIAKAERNMKGESEEKINKYVYNCINRESKSIEELCYSACAFKLLTNAKYNRIVTGDEELAQLLYVKAAHYATDNDSCSFILDSILHAYFDEKVPFFKRIFFFMKQYASH